MVIVNAISIPRLSLPLLQQTETSIVAHKKTIMRNQRRLSVMTRTILLLILFFFYTCIAAETEPRKLASLAEKWAISDNPAFEYTSLAFDLDFTVSDFVLDEMATYQMFDRNCAEGGNTLSNSALISTMTPDNTPNGVGDNNRTMNVHVNIDSNVIATDSNVYREEMVNNQVVGIIDFCLRFSLWTTTASPIEVNFREVIVTLTVDLTDGFSIGTLTVAPKDKIIRTANQVYEVEAYQCNFANVALSEWELLQTRNQGSLVRVCVRPNEEARNDGIYMRSIDDFIFERDYGGWIGLNQQIAIKDGKEADNLLTVLYCTSGDAVCAFDTILMAIFYRLPGSVQGSGVASMQFGSSQPSSGRRLRSVQARAAQEDLVAAVAEFELDFELLPRPKSVSSSPRQLAPGLCALITIFLMLLNIM